MTRALLILFAICMLIAGCQHDPPAPKPRAYPRVEFPEHKYLQYQSDECPFTFEYPAYAEIKKREETCWFDLFMPSFDARVHCSYIPVTDRSKFDDLVKDSYTIAARINARANYMEETPMINEQGVRGMILTWTGPAASTMHFFLTDTTQHFFKAALYFDSKVNPDSLQPIAQFIRQDITHMISTFRWKE
ncbi:MAG: hypothetical protein ABIQ02_00380 [Saprospiraceae bacterium]